MSWWTKLWARDRSDDSILDLLSNDEAAAAQAPNKPIAMIMEQAKKLAEGADTSKILGSGGFASVKEIEASYFIALVGDLTSMSDTELVDLVTRCYALAEPRTRLLIRYYRDSRRR